MPQLRVGIQLASLRQPFKKALLTAAQLGAEAVEIDLRHGLRPEELSQTGIRHIRKMLADLNLAVCAVGYPTRRGYNVAEDLDRRVEATKQAMTTAYQLGANVVVNHVGRIPADPAEREWDLLIEVLSDIGVFGQRAGAVLAAETGSEDSAQLSALIEALPQGALAVDLNPGNLMINNFSPREAVAELGMHVMHVHATDAVRDLAQGRGLETPLGRGSVDFPEIVGALEEHTYRGVFTIKRERANDPVGDIGAAVPYLRNL
jgi:sugar phosphate isomerase/epimerase